MSVNSMLTKIRKQTGSSNFMESKFGQIDHYLDTGIYGLNRIISGSCYNGIPAGRVTMLAGENQTAKSYIMAKTVGQALNGPNNYKHVFIFDGEGGAMKSMFESNGCNMENVEHIIVENVEDAAVKIANVIAEIKEHKQKYPEDNFICALDSLGALVPEKYWRDVDKGEIKSEMGGRAKICNNMMKSLTIPCLLTNTTFFVLNHIYDDPASMFPSKIKSQSGGKGAQYMCRVGIQLNKKFDKEGDAESDIEAFYKKNIINAFVYKNSFAKPFYDFDFSIDFSKGIDPYSGLLEPALKYGIITHEKSARTYQIPPYSQEKGWFLKNILDTSNPDSKKMWECILPLIDEKSKNDLAYSGAQIALNEQKDEMEIKEILENNEDIQNEG